MAHLLSVWDNATTRWRDLDDVVEGRVVAALDAQDPRWRAVRAWAPGYDVTWLVPWGTVPGVPRGYMTIIGVHALPPPPRAPLGTGLL